MRTFIFRHYWWIAIVVCAAAFTLAIGCGDESKMGFVGATIAAALGFCYFVQQQKLAETQLFHQLFTAFNARYDGLNDTLARIAGREGGLSNLPREDRNAIVDYFNLCAEEYLFYRQGYIYRDVWRSWCRGMAWYLKRHPFKDVWNEEVKTESFYGLTLERIIEGAV
jgi:hypothetical protein